MVEAPGIEGGRPIPVSTGFDLSRPDPGDNFGKSSTSEGDPIPVSTILDPFQRNTVTFVTGALDRALEALAAGDVEGARAVIEELRKTLGG
jgi:hypothetical protein